MPDVEGARRQFQKDVKALCEQDLTPTAFCESVQAAQSRMYDSILEDLRDFDDMFRSPRDGI
jgi:hypothetical protein